MDLEFNVNKQIVTRTDTNSVVNMSENYLQLKFTFVSNDWVGLDKYVFFKAGDGDYRVSLDEHDCLVVPSIVLTGRKFLFGLYGEDGNVVRITTNIVMIRLRESYFTGGGIDILDRIDVLEDNVSALMTGKSDVGHTHTKSDVTDFPSIPSKISDLTNDSDFVEKSSTVGLLKNDGTIDTTTYLSSLPSHTHGNLQSDGKVGTSNNASKNVVTDSTGKITTEAKPTIPSASSSTPLADVSGGTVGSGTTWARADHRHPKSTLYAESFHSHLVGDVVDWTDEGSVEVIDFVDEHFTGFVDNLINYDSENNKLYYDGSASTDEIATIGDLSGKADSTHTHGNLQNDGSVGTSNNASMNVVTDSNGKITTEAKPTIPSKISDLTNDSDFIETSSTTGLIKNDGTIDTSTYSTFSGSYSDLSNKPSIPSDIGDLDDADALDVTITYTDSTTATVTFVIYTPPTP